MGQNAYIPLIKITCHWDFVLFSGYANNAFNKKIQAIKMLCTTRKSIPNTACVWIFENWWIWRLYIKSSRICGAHVLTPATKLLPYSLWDQALLLIIIMVIGPTLVLIRLSLLVLYRNLFTLPRSPGVPFCIQTPKIRAVIMITRTPLNAASLHLPIGSAAVWLIFLSW